MTRNWVGICLWLGLIAGVSQADPPSKEEDDIEIATASRESGVVGSLQVELHQPENRLQKALGLAQRKVEHEAQRQGRLDRYVPELPRACPSRKRRRAPKSTDQETTLAQIGAARKCSGRQRAAA